MFTLRKFQADAIELARNLFREGKRRIIMFFPTGSGKTVIAAHMIASATAKGQKILFLAHRRELIRQCSDKLHALGIGHGIIMANEPLSPRASVQVASIQTVIRRRDIGEFGLIFLDECHHCRSESYHRVLDRFPQAAVVGLSATPYRLDGKGLGEIFQTIVSTRTVKDLTADGFLVPARVFAPSKIDMRGVKITGGDFNKQQMEAACCSTTIYGDIFSDWMKRGRGRPTVLFAVSVKQSQELCEKFQSAGVVAKHVDATTPPLDRDAILKSLGNGEIEILSNVGILTEGWDCPPASCAILARPTMSTCLHIQMIGRVLRPFRGKTDALILDHAGNHYRHGFITDVREVTLEGLKRKPKKENSKTPSVRICPKCYLCMPSGSPCCPACGHVFETETREIKMVDADLHELRPWQDGMLKPFDPDAPKETKYRPRGEPGEWFARKLQQAKESGKNPRWAYHVFRSVWGYWPDFTPQHIQKQPLKRSWSW